MFTSIDGICKSANAEFVNTWNEITKKQSNDKTTWIEMLREKGIKAAHPDDGWVDRKDNTVQFAYPQFDDGVKVGDIIALGWPDKFRLVKITDEIMLWLSRSKTYKFEIL